MKQALGQSWHVLRRSPSIVVPAMILGVICGGIAQVLAARGLSSLGFFGNLDAQGDGAFFAFLWTIVGLAWYLLSTILMIAVTTGMAHAAWTRGSGSLADALAPMRRSSARFFELLAILVCLDAVAATLVIPTFALSIPAFLAFFVYAIPGTLLDDRSGVDALVRSMAMTWGKFGVTFGVVIMLLLIALGGALISVLAGALPLGLKLAGWMLLGGATAFATLVLTGAYLGLPERPAAVPPSAT